MVYNFVLSNYLSYYRVYQLECLIIWKKKHISIFSKRKRLSQFRPIVAGFCQNVLVETTSIFGNMGTGVKSRRQHCLTSGLIDLFSNSGAIYLSKFSTSVWSFGFMCILYSAIYLEMGCPISAGSLLPAYPLEFQFYNSVFAVVTWGFASWTPLYCLSQGR